MPKAGSVGKTATTMATKKKSSGLWSWLTGKVAGAGKAVRDTGRGVARSLMVGKPPTTNELNSEVKRLMAKEHPHVKVWDREDVEHKVRTRLKRKWRNKEKSFTSSFGGKKSKKLDEDYEYAEE